MSEPWETTPSYADAYNRGASGLAAPLDPRLADAYQAGKAWMTPPAQTPFTPVMPPVAAPTYGPYYGGGSGTPSLGGGVGRLIDGAGWLPVMLIGLMVARPQTVAAIGAGIVGGSLALLTGKLLPGAGRLTLGGALKASFFGMLAYEATLYLAFQFGGATLQQLHAALLGWVQSVTSASTSSHIAQLVSVGLIAQIPAGLVYAGVNARLMRGPYAGVLGYLKACVVSAGTVVILTFLAQAMVHYGQAQRLAAQQRALAQLQSQLAAREQNSHKPRRMIAAARNSEPRAPQDASSVRKPDNER
jgi:uncharacterized membrane protein